MSVAGRRECGYLCTGTALLLGACGGQAAHADATSVDLDPVSPTVGVVAEPDSDDSSRHWLAYVSDEVTPRQALIYAVDLDDPLLTRTLLSVGLAAGEQVDSFAFAPDGQHLAFVVNRGEAGGYWRDLFVSQLSRDRAEPGISVPTSGRVYWPRERAWALDSTALLFGVETKPEEFELFSVGAEDWSAATRVAAGWQAHWISRGVAAVSSKAGLGYVRRDSLGFAPVRNWGFIGDLRAASPASERAGFIREVGPCLSQAYFVDVAAGRIEAFEALTSYSFSPTVEWLAVGRTTPARVDIHALAGGHVQSPILSLDVASACSVNWADDGSWITYVGADQGPHAVWLGQGRPKAYDIASVSQAVSQPPSLSGDHHFIAVAADRLFVSTLNDQLPAAAVPVSEPLARLETLRFSPDARGLLYIAKQEHASSNDIYWADLSGLAPAPGQALDARSSGNVEDAAWSPDSAAIAYRATEGPFYPGRSPVNLYLSRVHARTPDVRRVNADLHCLAEEPAAYCQGVSAFAFQP